jgi:hypothetical protein
LPCEEEAVVEKRVVPHGTDVPRNRLVTAKREGLREVRKE